jgi:hypothetical protein
MPSLRHPAYFVALGLFWGLSPSQYRYWGDAGVPVSHILVYTGFALALCLGLLVRHAPTAELSLAILMVALWLNNSGQAATPMST